ncbi:MAG: endo-1,4-beta-xylanase [Lachnospiraceae bacterium]|nr:endo-1,4-beta-xylanase [Lachnospiraceae bacterium]
MKKTLKQKILASTLSLMMALLLVLAPGFNALWVIKAQAEPDASETEDITITFAPDESFSLFPGKSTNPNNFFKSNGNSVAVLEENGFGRTDSHSLKVTKIAPVESYHHWVRMGHIADWATPGDEQLGLPRGASYTIAAWFYVPAEAAADKTISGPQIFLNNNAPGAFPITPEPIPVDTWTEVVFETAELFTNLDSISFRLHAENDSTYPDYWYLDDITVVRTGGGALKPPVWDLRLPSLKETYQDYFMLGNIITGPSQLEDSETALEAQAMLTHHYNSLTAENHNKPSSVINAEGQYTGLDTVRKMIEFSQENDFAYIGHTLVWHSQSSQWLHGTASEPLTRAVAKSRMEDYINRVAGADGIKGNVYAWDVVNEAFLPGVGVFSGDWTEHLRTGETEGMDASPWYASYENGADSGESGADYIYDAFVFARLADPNAILYYNDFNDEQRGKSMAIAAMVKEINEKWTADDRYDNRLLIEGIGLQGHYNTNISVSSVETAILHYLTENPGVKLSITELDLTIAGTDQTTPPDEEQLIKQALMYAELFEIYKKYAAGPANDSGNPQVIERVTLWGTNDAESWRSFGQNGGTGGYPTLFNGDYSAKEAFHAVIDPSSYIEAHIPPEFEIKEGAAFYTDTAPALDGKSAAWDIATPIAVELNAIGKTDLTAVMKLLWDADNLYVRVEVKDDEIDLSSENEWERDSVEIFLSETNFRGSYTVSQGKQYRIDASGTQTSKESYGVWNGYAELTSDGYLIEAALPWDDVPSLNDVIGFDIQINNPPPASSQRPQVTWCDPNANGYNSSDNWGQVTLVGEMAGLVLEEIEIAEEVLPEETEAAEAEAKSYLVPIILGVIFGVAVGTAVYVVKKRKRA